MRHEEDLPPFLDGWDELSALLDDEPELRALSALGSRVDADPARSYDGSLPF